MSNRSMNATSLDDVSGICSDLSRSSVVGVCIKSALAGSLTLVGVTNADGSPAAWVIAASTVGFVAAPGSKYSGRLSFAYANGADAGSAIVILSAL